MAGTHVTIAVADGRAFDSYVAAPAADKGAGVVICVNHLGRRQRHDTLRRHARGGRVCRVRPRYVLARRRPGSRCPGPPKGASAPLRAMTGTTSSRE